MRKQFISALLAATTSLVTYAQGIPTIDVANLAQSLNQVLAWQQQYQQMLQQIEQMRQQNQTASDAFKAISGSRGLGQIANQITQSVIRPDFGRQLAATQSHEEAGVLVTSQLENLRASSGTRFGQIQVLMFAINGTTDAKGIAELNARIQAEQAMIQNEVKEANVLQQLYTQQVAALDAARLKRSIQADSMVPKAK